MVEELFKGFPRYFWANGIPIVYEIKLDNGSVRQAIVDPSRQYSAEGLQWKDIQTKSTIPKHKVIGYRNLPKNTQADQ